MATETSALQPRAGAGDEEVRLAQAAAAGDGQAFATLYERYEGRAFNLALRITASRDDAADATQEAFLNVMRRLPSLADRELAFGSYLFTAARNASYDLIEKRRRAEPSGDIPESAAPVGPGGGFDPGDPHDDPERGVLLEAQQEEIRTANERLPARQREVLALRELEEMSYDEIAEIMDLNRNSVAQLISRARLKLRDELRGTALASIGLSSPECERALPLISARDDDELVGHADQAEWLAAHITACETCRLRLEAVQEAGASYRVWAPVAVSPLLFRDTIAKAAELTGSNWDDAAAELAARRSSGRAELAAGGAGGVVAGGKSSLASASDALKSHRRRDLALVAAIALVLVLTLFETALHEAEQGPRALPAASGAPASSAKAPRPPSSSEDRRGATPSSQAPAAARSRPAGPTRRRSPFTIRSGEPRTTERTPAPLRRGQVPLPGLTPAPAPAPQAPAPTAPVEPPVLEQPPATPPPAPDPPPPTCQDAAGRPIPCP